MWLRHIFLCLTMQIVSWNVNSAKARLPHILDYLREVKPDVLCLQELKCIDDAFPKSEVEDLGYNVETFGQKTYNGVAILSRFPIEDVIRGIPNFEDEQSRYIEAVINDGVTVCRVASIYLPNGNPVDGGDGPKFTYKLAFMKALKAHAETLLSYEEATVLAGDYNIIPNDVDCYAPEAWRDDALFRDDSRAHFRAIKNLGYSDALELIKVPSDETYTFWDYQAGAFPKNNGIRIDHHLLSPMAADLLKNVRIDRHMRERDKPSDHVPIAIQLGA